MSEDLEVFLSNQYLQLEKRNSREKKVQLLALIIDLKFENPILRNKKNSLYLDVKRFISVYLRNKRSKDFGYEDYDGDIILKYILKKEFSDEEKYRLLIFTRNLLKSLSYENSWLNKYIYEQQLVLTKKKSKFKWLLLLSSRNLVSILISILLMFLVECIILLPAPFSYMEWFTIEKSDFSSNAVVNHICNVLSLHFNCVENSAKLSFDALGLFSLIISSFVYIVLGVNFLFRNLIVNFEIDVAE